MTNNKKTQKEFYGELRELALNYGTPEQVEFIDKKIEQVSKKKESTGMTQTQKDNEVTKCLIVDTLVRLGKAVTISELQDADETLAGFTNQKLSALLRQLKENKDIERVVDKKKAYFKIAE